MDLRRAIAALLIGASAIGAGGTLPLREAKWIAPEARLEALTSLPSACLAEPIGNTQLIIAQAAFQTPLLLGGQAARTGLSCASCHPNGRANQAFQFPGLSGAPGTADVTSSIMSHTRGDAIFNPVRIPDLAVDRAKVSRDPTSRELKVFVRGLIVEEFDGPEPSAAVLEALVVYIRAMRPGACQLGKRVPVTLGLHLTDIESALAVAELAATVKDKYTAWLMLAAARHKLGLIHERYVGGKLAKQRAKIIRADGEVKAWQEALETAKPLNAEVMSEVTAGLHIALASSETRSLYNSVWLARAHAQ